jgi:hypothetical protein
VSAAEKRGTGELGLASPLGKVEGLRGMGGWRVVGGMVADKLSVDDGAHRVALSGRGALPEDTEALVADRALNVFLLF